MATKDKKTEATTTEEPAQEISVPTASQMTTLATGALMPAKMSPALAIYFDPDLFEKAKWIANNLSKAEGFVPRHLLGKVEACFAVVTRSLVWKLDPYAVAGSIYQTPGGSVGYEGKLCQAALENSGRIEGEIEFEHFGEWERIVGKFEIQTSAKGNKYPVQTWTPADEEGLGVIVSAQLRGEAKRRTMKFNLKQAFPRNSTLWATDPETQICYAAVRRFANLRVPGLFMGVAFDREDMAHYGPDRAIDVTPPRPERPAYTDAAGDEVPEGKSLREQAIERADAKEAAAKAEAAKKPASKSAKPKAATKPKAAPKTTAKAPEEPPPANEQGEAEPPAAETETTAPDRYQFVNWDGEVSDHDAEGFAAAMQIALGQAPDSGIVQALMETNGPTVSLLAEHADRADLVVAIEEARDARLEDIDAAAAEIETGDTEPPETEAEPPAEADEAVAQLRTKVLADIQNTASRAALQEIWTEASRELMNGDCPDDVIGECRQAWKDKRQLLIHQGK